MLPCITFDCRYYHCFFFFFNDTATTEIYTLSLHDALPICRPGPPPTPRRAARCRSSTPADRKSTRLNSSHITISYAVFCLKKKNTTSIPHPIKNKKKNKKTQKKKKK